MSFNTTDAINKANSVPAQASPENKLDKLAQAIVALAKAIDDIEKKLSQR